ncbi:MAG TPA: DNA primase [Candidatus Omnitrophota bacterium]|nr:DNA primase [Candidatus Omnitrophota bacterium]HPT07589.1 DNA primase [Candidatus Omnitrophota bacterium]
MPGLIPQSALDEILGRVDIVELISGYIPLKKSGRNFKAPCPFHNEKTPSFMVSPERQIYHCFGCGESGNAFKFLMKYERLEFPEAVEHLAKKAGVVLPETRPQDSTVTNLLTQLYTVNDLAVQYYASNLISSAGVGARAYLSKRGITDDSIAHCKLGLALDKWDGLITYMRQKGVTLGVLEKAGLILAKDSGGGYYDRFRGRLIFPIFDIKGRPIAFGARVLDDSLPKYINSCETPVYVKGKNLYGFHLAKDFVRDLDHVLVVEGYLDFLVPFQQGIGNIVASLGTALTSDQVRMVKRYTHNAVMIYDADQAGQMAALRSLDIFIEEEMQVRVASLPAGFDPDLFVRKYGAEGFRLLVEKAENLFDFKLRLLKGKYNADSIEGKARIASEMLSTIAKFKHAVMQSEYVKKLADVLSVNEEALWSEIKKEKKRPDSSAQSGNTAVSAGFQDNPTEKLLFKLMLEETHLIDRIRRQLDPEEFQDERISQIVSKLFDFVEQGKLIEPSSLIHYFDDECTMKFICESAIPSDVAMLDKEKVVDDCIRRLKTKNRQKRKISLQEKIKSAQDEGKDDELSRLMQEFDELLKSQN